jgi:hypothetical protein
MNNLNRRKKAFVIMPFSDEYRDFYVLGVREILKAYGYVCCRADEIQVTGRMIDTIMQAILNSDLIIVELTEVNGNVYYELGIAHAYKKYVILCTKDHRNTVSDIRDLYHIVYCDIVDLRRKLNDILKIQVSGVANGVASKQL